MTRIALLLAAALSFTSLPALKAAAPAKPRASRADAADRFLLARMSELKIPGMSVAVLKDGRLLKARAYGFANLELRAPASLGTSFPLASMTKTFTAVAVMQLVEQGKVALDQPVADILPELPAAWSKVTLRHCLSHTTGLPSATDDDVNVGALAGDAEALFHALAPLPVDAPGTKISYNTTDFVLLSRVIEKASGLGFEAYIQRHILDPAGMSTARFGDAWAVIPGRADLYTNLDITPDHARLLMKEGKPVVRKDGILHYGHKVWPDFMSSGAGLNGSVRDLVAFERALAAGKLIKASSLAEMTRPYKMADGSDDFFGLGFVTFPLGGEGSVSYGGGAATWRLEIPKQRLTLIVLTNLQGAQPENFIADLAALYGARPAKP